MNKQGKHGIEWTDYTLNQMTGCLNGCEYCYARRIATRFNKRYLSNPNVAAPFSGGSYTANALEDPFWPRIWDDRFNPLKGYPNGTKIFLDDMSDWMGPWIPDEWKIRTLDFIKAHPQYIFQTLTKQPQNLPKWSPFPKNCHVGVTATNWLKFSDALGYLAAIEAKVKYLSFEPLLGEIKFDMLQKMLFPRVINWLIIGLQTPYSPKTAPKIEHVREIVEAADKAGIPIFLKNNLQPLLQQNNHNIYSFPEWAGKQFAITGDHSLAPCGPHANEPMRQLRQEWPRGI